MTPFVGRIVARYRKAGWQRAEMGLGPLIIEMPTESLRMSEE